MSKRVGLYGQKEQLKLRNMGQRSSCMKAPRRQETLDDPAKAVKVRPGFLWKLQNTGDSIATRHLWRTAEDKKWNHFKRKKFAAGSKARWLEFIKPSGSRKEAIGLKVSSVEFWSFFGQNSIVMPPGFRAEIVIIFCAIFWENYIFLWLLWWVTVKRLP